MIRYHLQYFPNPNLVQIHIDQRLIHGVTLTLDGLIGPRMQRDIEREAIDKDALINFYEAINLLDGVEASVKFYRYCIEVRKPLLFSWDTIIPHVLEAMAWFLTKNYLIVEASPPEYPSEQQMKAAQAWLSTMGNPY